MYYFLLNYFAQVCKNFCTGAEEMKSNFIFKIFVLLATIFLATNAFAGSADISKMRNKGDWSTIFGAKYTTGMNEKETSQTDFSAGRIASDNFYLDYTFHDKWTVSFDTDNNYSDSELGIQWVLVKTLPFKLELMGDWGIALTKNAKTDDRFGENNFVFGFNTHGIFSKIFQWYIEATGQYVFADPDNFWTINLSFQGMSYFTKNLAASLAFDYNFLQIGRPKTLFDRSLTLGLIYNITNKISVNPNVQFHFKTKNEKYNLMNSQDYWQIALDFSINF